MWEGAEARDRLCAGWSKKPPAKKLFKRKKLWSIISLIQGQCHFSMGEEIVCIAGNMLRGGEAGCLHRQVVKAKADRELQ